MPFLQILALSALMIGIVILAWYTFSFMLNRYLKIDSMRRMAEDPAFRQMRLTVLAHQIEANPQAPKPRLERANIYWIEGNHAGIVEDLSVYLKTKSEDDSAWGELAAALLHLGQSEEALIAIGEARKRDGHYLEFFLIEAQCLLCLERFEDLEVHLAAWTEEDERQRLAKPVRRKLGQPLPPPREPDPSISFCRAALHLGRNEIDEARALVGQALERAPRFSEVIPRAPGLTPLEPFPPTTVDDPDQERD